MDASDHLPLFTGMNAHGSGPDIEDETDMYDEDLDLDDEDEELEDEDDDDEEDDDDDQDDEDDAFELYSTDDDD